MSFVPKRKGPGRSPPIWLALLLLTTVTSFAQTINYIEYFYDDDPGLGSATAVTFTPGATVDLSINTPQAGIASGTHSLFIRARDSLGHWSIPIVKYCLIERGVLTTPNIVQGEYYVDSDPGYGLGHTIAFTQGDSIQFAFTCDLTGISAGFHFMFIRFRDTNGDWGVPVVKSFVCVRGSIIPPNIVGGEYFFDTDPGYGLGHSISVTPNDTIEHTVVCDMTSISAGFHTLFMRYRDATGNWGIPAVKTFVCVLGSTLPPNIVGGEYFVDNDPGYGQAHNIPVTVGNIVDQTVICDMTGIPAGFHTLFMRYRDATGNWGVPIVKTFVCVNGGLQPPNIVSGEYFFDSDPGYGLAHSITVTPNDTVDQTVVCDMTGVSAGFHTLFMRYHDATGNWSLPLIRLFVRERFSSQPPNIVSAEYFFDNDPGFGQGNNVALTPIQSGEVQVTMNLTNVSNGLHIFYIRVRDALGNWSMTHRRPFIKEMISTPPASIVTAQYLLDAVPGQGAAISSAISGGNNYQTTVLVDLSNATEGFHDVFMRVGDTLGLWSIPFHYHFQNFFPSSITLQHPIGGETLVIGTYDTIRWSSVHVTSNVRILLNRNYPSGSWDTLATVPDSLRSFRWLVNGPSSIYSRVRVSWVDTNSVQATSNSDFIIGTPLITVNRPNGGEVFINGTTDSIRWTSQYLTGNARIELNRNYPGGAWDSLTTVGVSSSPYLWSVSGAVTNNARIRVRSLTMPAIADTSDANFSIVNATITVVYPSQRDTLIALDTVTIRWVSSHLVGNAFIQLNRHYPIDTWDSVTTVPVAADSFAWRITGGPLLTQDSCRIRITSVTLSFVSDVSDTNFVIVTPIVLVNRPNGGETFVLGSTDTIRWNTFYLRGTDSVRILVNPNYPVGTWNTIGTFGYNVSPLNWLVSGTTGTSARIRAYWTRRPWYADTSNANFAIVRPTLNLTAPDSGTWYIGDQRSITWNSQYLSDSVNVTINRNYPSGTWEPIIRLPISQNSYSWRISGPPTTNAKFRVQSTQIITVGDTSVSSVTLARQSLTLLHPNGGDTLVAGGRDTIRWTSSPVFLSTVQIQLSRNYPNGVWTTIIDSTANDSLESWQPVIPASNNSRIRILAVNDTTIGDTSNTDFSIVTPSLMIRVPNGGEVWSVNSQQTIQWTRYRSNGSVEVHLNRNYPTGTWELLGTTANDSLSRTVNLPASNHLARIRVRLANDTTNFDVSDSSFSIIVNSLWDRFTGIPTVFSLASVYPNPFNQQLRIVVGVPQNSEVKLRVFNILGREIAVIYSGHLTPGYHPILWQPTALASGMYFIRMEAPNFIQLRKMEYLR